MRYVLKSLEAALFASLLVLGIFAWNYAAQAKTNVLHAYGNSSSAEITNLIAVDKLKLLPLLPDGYQLIPASALGLGGEGQGIVVIVNFRAIEPVVDHYFSGINKQVAIDIAILVAQPAKAAAAGLDIAGANHLYTLAIYSNDARYVASLQNADMPAEFNNKITYDREIDDGTGVGQLIVTLPDKRSPLESFNLGLSLPPAVGAFNAILWYEGKKGTAVLHFLHQSFYLGNASSKVYTQTGNELGSLLTGGGLGPCAPDPQTGHACVMSPSLNLRYPQGMHGELFLMGQVAR